MPVAHFHLTDCSDEQRRDLLVQASRSYAEILQAPIERVRIFVHALPAAAVAVGGVPLDETGGTAPYFTALMMRGRPEQVRARLLAEFTDLCVSVLGAQRDSVRGLITEIDPAGWGIGGRPASAVRADEIAQRARAHDDTSEPPLH
ncbi:MAG: tautomerase family protein [Actinomycetales bacterium]